MRPRVQREAIQRLLAMTQEPSQEIPTRTERLPVDRYLETAEFEKERLALFHRQPVVVAHVSELERPGDYVTENVAGVPIVVIRDSTGEIRTFVNACRHRGARLFDEEAGACNKAITCRYHAWSYHLNGKLLHVPNEEVFDALDHEALSLRSVAHEVRHGFVWVVIDRGAGANLDVSKALGPVLDDDFGALDLAKHRVERRVVTTRKANWKLVMDAFAEGYHVKSLHRKSLSRFFLNGQILDDCAPHVRQIGARKSLLEAVREDPNGWDFRRDTTAFYTLFPNSVIVLHPVWLSQMSIMPEGIDGVRVVHRMMAPDEPRDDQTEERLHKSFHHIQEEVFEKEDLSIVESIQSTLASGANESVILGGLEEGMRLFHAARDRAITEQ